MFLVNRSSGTEHRAHSFWVRLFYDVTHPSALSRFGFFLLADLCIVTLSLWLSFLVHFDFNMRVPYGELLQEVLLLFVVLKIASFVVFRVYKMTWRYVGVSDLMNIVLAVVVAEMVLLILSLPNSLFTLPITGIAKRVFLVDGFFTLAFISGLRISKKLYREVIRQKGPVQKGKRTLIVGAGNTGEMLIRDMARNGFAAYYPIGFLDDDHRKIGTYMHGVKVRGGLDMLKEVIVREQVAAVIIAIPSLNHKTLRGLYQTARESKVGTVKVVPRIYDFDRPDINLKGLEDISIEDLIGRQVVSVDYRSIRTFLEGKVVLVTGAGGSIGMEIVTQVCTFDPRQVVLFEIDETELHNLSLRLGRLFPQLAGRIVYVTGDVSDEGRVREVFGRYTPEIVFHAAAYKHVPMMEYNPREAARVNIFGTRNIARAAVECGTENFVMISTDKAVRPTSVMGATKRMAESICRTFNREDGSGSTKFMSVRFGNVLGSRGSVLPLFLDQLKYGGPLTVTDPEMKRYFMTIPEAVSLVLQASTLGNGGEVFVLDMGEPVMIVHVAEELIRLHGLEPYKDIDITFTGLRPGEKLFEEILTAEEGTDASCHEKIFIARNGTKYTPEELARILEEFAAAVRNSSDEGDEKMKALLKRYVEYYEEE